MLSVWAGACCGLPFGRLLTEFTPLNNPAAEYGRAGGLLAGGATQTAWGLASMAAGALGGGGLCLQTGGAGCMAGAVAVEASAAVVANGVVAMQAGLRGWRDTFGAAQPMQMAGGGTTGPGGGSPSAAGASAGGSASKAADLLAPGGVRIGEAGANAEIRVVAGGVAEAEQLFDALAAGGTPFSGYPKGRAVRLPGGGFVGLRFLATGTGGRRPPAATIDVKIPGIQIREVKFVP